MLNESNFTPVCLRMLTTAAEKPHWGIAGLPFMNSMTRPRAMVSVMRLRRSSVTVELLSSVSLALILFRRRGRQCQRMNWRARSDDGVAQRGVHQPMSVDRPLAHERRRHDGRVEVVAAARRVGDADVGVGQRCPDPGTNVVGGHGLLTFRRVYSTEAPFLPALYSIEHDPGNTSDAGDDDGHRLRARGGWVCRAQGESREPRSGSRPGSARDLGRLAR